MVVMPVSTACSSASRATGLEPESKPIAGRLRAKRLRRADDEQVVLVAGGAHGEALVAEVALALLEGLEFGTRDALDGPEAAQAREFACHVAALHVAPQLRGLQFAGGGLHGAQAAQPVDGQLQAAVHLGLEGLGLAAEARQFPGLQVRAGEAHGRGRDRQADGQHGQRQQPGRRALDQCPQTHNRPWFDVLAAARLDGRHGRAFDDRARAGAATVKKGGSGAAIQGLARWRRSGALEVDVPLLVVQCDQPHRERIADVGAFQAAHQPAFQHRAGDAHEGALGRGAGDDGIEGLADAPAQQGRAGGLEHLALDAVGVVLLQRAVPGDGLQLLQRIRGRLPEPARPSPAAASPGRGSGDWAPSNARSC
jgi:hypothetical protein